MSFRPEDVDLAEVAESLERTTSGVPLMGYFEGKTALRDLVVTELGCSELEAEQVVDTMVSTGFLRYSGDLRAPTDEGLWVFQNSAAS